MKSKKVLALTLIVASLVITSCSTENEITPQASTNLSTTFSEQELDEIARNRQSALEQGTLGINSLTCPAPADFYLRKVGSGKPLYPGQHALAKNTTYKVWAVGNTNSAIICVDPGNYYTIEFSTPHCEDVGYGQEAIIGTITTAASIPGGITINTGVICTSGNGSTTQGYSYSVTP